MKASFYYDGHYKKVSQKVKNYLNSNPILLSKDTIDSTRAVGDTVESVISDQFENFLGNWCKKYYSDFSRKDMEDLAFTDKEEFYSAIDVKTHREDTDFNMPNLTSVDKLSKFYETDKNIFSILIVKYRIEDQSKIRVSDVDFLPIEFLSWDCLTIGALGKGQIQIRNSNQIIINDGYSRKKWMLEFCDVMAKFYPKEIEKITDRIYNFERIREDWNEREDIWRKV